MSPLDAAIERMISLPKFCRGLCLRRVLWLEDAVRAHFPNQQPQVIKVVGTNGKGSTLAFLSAMLQNLGIAHLSYTSPHLFDFRERYRLNHTFVDDTLLAQGIDWVFARIEEFETKHPHDQVGSFDAMTILARYLALASGVDVMLVEAGIGGRLDATRPLPGDLVALTSLDLEHTGLLGHSLEEIAYEKMAACPSGGTLVVGPLASLDLEERVKAYARISGIDCTILHPETPALSFQEGMMCFTLKLKDEDICLKSPLLGEHQVHNCAVALTLVQHLLPKLGQNWPEARAAVIAGVAQAQHAGRFERIHQNPSIYVDAGHTPVAMQMLAATVEKALGQTPIVLVLGASEDKDIDRIVSPILPIAKHIICTRAHYKGAAVDQIVAAVNKQNRTAATSPAIEPAMQQAITLAQTHGATILVAGGLFLAAEATAVIRGQDPTKLRFY